MRLVNAHNLAVKKFASRCPPYVVLSHCWTEEETNFKEFSKGRLNWNSLGINKVRGLCKYVKDEIQKVSKACNRPVDWVWVDTCCIDERNSSEVTENINSMWTIYAEAVACVVYLSDVDTRPQAPVQRATYAQAVAKPGNRSANQEVVLERLKQSRWFTRGWTLQELLAPTEIVFCDVRWSTIGVLNTDPFLHIAVSEAAQIERKYLTNQWNKNAILKRASVAKKLSWASRRETSKPEDISYCLLGLLDVNMPLVYGEGKKKAFRRLQQEFIKQSDDESIFAWIQSTNHSKWTCGILAPDVSFFRDAGNVELIQPSDDGYISRPPYQVTNKGLQLESLSTSVQELSLGEPQRRGRMRSNQSSRRPSCDGTRTPEPSRQLWLISLNCCVSDGEPRSFSMDSSGSGPLPNRGVLQKRDSVISSLGEERNRCVIALQESKAGASRTAANTFRPAVADLQGLSDTSMEKKFLIKLTDERLPGWM